MKKIKFQLGAQPFCFDYKGKQYELAVKSTSEIAILNGFQIPANELIRIRKKDNTKASVTDYYVFRHYGKPRANYFCLGDDDFIRFKFSNVGYHIVDVTLYPTRTEEIYDYALRVSEKKTPEGMVSSFGIRSVHDTENRGKINCRQLFHFNGEDFELQRNNAQDEILYEFYEQAVSNIIDMTRSCFVRPTIADKRILPHEISAYTAKPFDQKMKRKFFKGNYVNELILENPTFLEQFLASRQNEYSMVTLECRILGELNLQRIDCYVFNGTNSRTHIVAYQDGIQFMHFKDYCYHIRYEAGTINGKSVIKVFENSQEILKLEISYNANVNNRLEGLNKSTKEKIIAALTKIQ